MRKNTALKLTPVEPLAEPNPLIVVGSNNPPEPTPYEAVKARIDDLVSELRLSADGAKVETQELCDYFANIEAMLRDAKKAAEAALKDEKGELTKQVNEIQDRYNLLIGDNKSVTGSAILAIATAKKIQEPFLVAKAKALDAERERLRKIAEEAEEKAREALRASSVENLAEREEAEQLVTEARIANTVANKAEHTTAKAGGTFGRSTSLRKVYSATLNPASEDGMVEDGRILALRYFCKERPRDVCEMLQKWADEHIRFGDHSADELPGFTISSELKVL